MDKKKSVAISIIIPFYNVNKMFFDMCFRSIKNQSFCDFEVIIVDDGSEKEFAVYLDEMVLYDDRFRVLHQGNKGVSEARNIGIKNAKGRTICFIDADDYIASWTFEDLWNVYCSNDVDAVCAYYSKTNGNEFVFSRNNFDVTIKNRDYLKKKTLIGMNCSASSNGYLSAGPVAVLFNSEIAKRILFPAGIKYMEDVIWNYLYYDKCSRIAILKECVYAYRQNDSSATHTYSISMIDERLKALHILKKLVGRNNEWFALRVFANYAICCQCCVLDKSFPCWRERSIYIRLMNKNPIWNEFKGNRIAKKWDRPQKIKRLIALLGLMPLVYYLKSRRKKDVCD